MMAEDRLSADLKAPTVSPLKLGRTATTQPGIGDQQRWPTSSIEGECDDCCL
jgi:hypothetical protein